VSSSDGVFVDGRIWQLEDKVIGWRRLVVGCKSEDIAALWLRTVRNATLNCGGVWGGNAEERKDEDRRAKSFISLVKRKSGTVTSQTKLHGGTSDRKRRSTGIRKSTDAKNLISSDNLLVHK